MGTRRPVSWRVGAAGLALLGGGSVALAQLASSSFDGFAGLLVAFWLALGGAGYLGLAAVTWAVGAWAGAAESRRRARSKAWLVAVPAILAAGFAANLLHTQSIEAFEAQGIAFRVAYALGAAPVGALFLVVEAVPHALVALGAGFLAGAVAFALATRR